MFTVRLQGRGLTRHLVFGLFKMTSHIMEGASICKAVAVGGWMSQLLRNVAGNSSCSLSIKGTVGLHDLYKLLVSTLEGSLFIRLSFMYMRVIHFLDCVLGDALATLYFV